MGQMRFIVSPPQRITEEVLQFTYMSGMDRTPWVVHAEADDGELVLERDVSDSGSVTVPWHVEGHGLLALSTGTLVERWEPYHLPLELARGTINVLRTQLYEWQSIGLTVPDEVYGLLKEALLKFSWAVVQQDGGDAAAAQEALRIALDGSQLLAAAYAEQVIAVRRRATGRLPSLLGGTLSSPEMDEAAARSFLAAFNMAMVPVYWRDVEATEGSFDWSACDRQIQWCREQGLRICLGPLLQPDARGLPDWVYLWDDDFESLLSAAGQFVDAAVNRYRGKVDLWHCAARVNTSQVLRFSEEEKLRMVAWIVCRVKQLDPDHPPMIGIDQPWGEYQGRRAVDLSPIHFADALVRARLDLKAIFLEMNFGCFAGGTLLAERNRRQPAAGLLGPAGPAAAGRLELAQRRRRRPPGPAEDRLLGRFVESRRAAGLGGALRAADPCQTGDPGGGLEPVRRRPAARVSPCRPAHSARSGQAGPAHARGPPRGLYQSRVRRRRMG